MRRSLGAVIILVIVFSLLAGTPARGEISRAQEVRARVFGLLNDGIKAYKEGRPKDAIPLLQEAADTALNSFRAYYYLGLALKADRRYLKAIDPLQIAIELDPVNLQARVALGDCYLQRGDPTEALAEYHRVLAIQDDYAAAWDGLGRAAESSGDVEKAIEYYLKATNLNPGFPDPSLNLGDLYMREGRHGEAIELFLRAIKVRPDFAAAYNRLGVAYARLQLNNEAIAALRQAAVLESGNPWHPMTIGTIFLELDNLIQAGREFDGALAIDSDYLEGYVAKADLLRRQGRLEEAVALLEEGLDRDVDDERTKALMRKKRAQVAGEHERLAGLTARLETDPADTMAVVDLAKLKGELGDHAAAVNLLHQATAAAAAAGHQDPDLLGHLGYNALRSEMYRDAYDAYQELSGLLPRNSDVFINLGLACIGMGAHPQAETALLEASRLQPGDARPLAYLGNLYVITGRQDKAIQSLEASLALLEEGAEGRRRIERLLDALKERRKEQL